MVVVVFWSREEELKIEDGRRTAPFCAPPQWPSLRLLRWAVCENARCSFLDAYKGRGGVHEWKERVSVKEFHHPVRVLHHQRGVSHYPCLP